MGLGNSPHFVVSARRLSRDTHFSPTITERKGLLGTWELLSYKLLFDLTPTSTSDHHSSAVPPIDLNLLAGMLVFSIFPKLVQAASPSFRCWMGKLRRYFSDKTRSVIGEVLLVLVPAVRFNETGVLACRCRPLSHPTTGPDETCDIKHLWF